MAQQARNLAWQHQDGVLSATHLLHDRDSKFSEVFDKVIMAEGVKVVRLPFRAPSANAYAERWVGTVRREVLDHLLIFGPRQLKRVLEEFIDHRHRARPHQSLESPTLTEVAGSQPGHNFPGPWSPKSSARRRAISVGGY